MFIGRFSIETFIVAPGARAAPVVHTRHRSRTRAPTRRRRPCTRSTSACGSTRPADAVKAGCPGRVTPFNGDHTAGVQVLSTRNFGDAHGPLRQLKP